jgi:alkylation response protein AidB-like acyl-CoA dehydrogenase
MSVATHHTQTAGSKAPVLDPEELEALRGSIEKVLTSECDSRAVHAYIDDKSTLDQSLWSQAADLGWMALALPENWGGLGLGPVGLQVLHGELGRRTAPGPYVATLSVGQWIAEIGTEEQQNQFLPLIGGGELTAAVPASIGMGAPLKLQGSSVNGKIDVLGAPDAGLVVLPVGSGGAIEAWALLQPDGTSASLRRRDLWDRTREVCTVECASAPVAGLVPDPDGSIGSRLRRHAALALAADSLGAAANISNQTVEYLKTRIQFEKPIASFQAIKHRAADQVISIATQRYVLAQAVESAMQDSPDADFWASLAKAGATKVFAYVAADCIQLHGGVGHTWEFDPHIYAKRARLNEALAADNRALLDFGAEALASATKAGRVTTELGI